MTWIISAGRIYVGGLDIGSVDEVGFSDEITYSVDGVLPEDGDEDPDRAAFEALKMNLAEKVGMVPWGDALVPAEFFVRANEEVRRRLAARYPETDREKLVVVGLPEIPYFRVSARDPEAEPAIERFGKFEVVVLYGDRVVADRLAMIEGPEALDRSVAILDVYQELLVEAADLGREIPEADRGGNTIAPANLYPIVLAGLAIPERAPGQYIDLKLSPISSIRTETTSPDYRREMEKILNAMNNGLLIPGNAPKVSFDPGTKQVLAEMTVRPPTLVEDSVDGRRVYTSKAGEWIAAGTLVALDLATGKLVPASSGGDQAGGVVALAGTVSGSISMPGVGRRGERRQMKTATWEIEEVYDGARWRAIYREPPTGQPGPLYYVGQGATFFEAVALVGGWKTVGLVSRVEIPETARIVCLERFAGVIARAGGNDAPDSFYARPTAGGAALARSEAIMWIADAEERLVAGRPGARKSGAIAAIEAVNIEKPPAPNPVEWMGEYRNAPAEVAAEYRTTLMARVSPFSDRWLPLLDRPTFRRGVARVYESRGAFYNATLDDDLLTTSLRKLSTNSVSWTDLRIDVVSLRSFAGLVRREGDDPLFVLNDAAAFDLGQIGYIVRAREIETPNFVAPSDPPPADVFLLAWNNQLLTVRNAKLVPVERADARSPILVEEPPWVEWIEEEGPRGRWVASRGGANETWFDFDMMKPIYEQTIATVVLLGGLRSDPRLAPLYERTRLALGVSNNSSIEVASRPPPAAPPEPVDHDGEDFGALARR